MGVSECPHLGAVWTAFYGGRWLFYRLQHREDSPGSGDIILAGITGIAGGPSSAFLIASAITGHLARGTVRHLHEALWALGFLSGYHCSTALLLRTAMHRTLPRKRPPGGLILSAPLHPWLLVLIVGLALTMLYRSSEDSNNNVVARQATSWATAAKLHILPRTDTPAGLSPPPQSAAARWSTADT